jgi:hypothetical protein
MLIANTLSDGENYSYMPRSDFYLALDGSIYLLVEVQSNENEADRYRMLLQAACATRLGNSLRQDDPFIVTAFYITSSGRMQRYFLFLSNRPPQVCLRFSIEAIPCP